MTATRAPDLALQSDPARRLLPWLLAIIVYLAGLALAGMMSLSAAVERWDQGLTGTVTIQIPVAAPATDKAELANALAVLKAMPDVASARALDREEIGRLLEPWLGAGAIARELPLPHLIDVRLRAGARIDLEGLTALIRAAAPRAVVDDHREALARLIALARSVEAIAVAIVGLVAIAAVATIVFITRTGLALHAESIELLHLIGATDGYVARQFQAQALGLGLKGGLAGLALTVATVMVIGRAAGAIGAGLVPTLTLSAAQWGALAAIPAVVGLVGMLTARLVVIAALRKLP